MKIRLKTGKHVTLAEDYGPEQYLRAAELSGVPAQMTHADEQLLAIATTMVVVEGVQEEIEPAKVDPQTKQVTEKAKLGPVKTIQDICGDAVATKDMLLSFRKSFSNLEWAQLQNAFDKVYDQVKKAEVEDYEILG